MFGSPSAAAFGSNVPGPFSAPLGARRTRRTRAPLRQHALVHGLKSAGGSRELLLALLVAWMSIARDIGDTKQRSLEVETAGVPKRMTGVPNP